MNKYSLKNIVKFIAEISETRSSEEIYYKKEPSTGRELALRVFDNLPKELMRNKIEEGSLKDIQKLIKVSKKIGRWGVISPLIKQIESELKKKIKEFDVRDISYLIWNISDGVSLPIEYNSLKKNYTFDFLL